MPLSARCSFLPIYHKAVHITLMTRTRVRESIRPNSSFCFKVVPYRSRKYDLRGFLWSLNGHKNVERNSRKITVVSHYILRVVEIYRALFLQDMLLSFLANLVFAMHGLWDLLAFYVKDRSQDDYFSSFQIWAAIYTNQLYQPL